MAELYGRLRGINENEAELLRNRENQERAVKMIEELKAKVQCKGMMQPRLLALAQERDQNQRYLQEQIHKEQQANTAQETRLVDLDGLTAKIQSSELSVWKTVRRE